MKTLIIMTGICITVLLAACGGSSAGPNSSPTPNSSAAPAPTVPPAATAASAAASDTSVPSAQPTVAAAQPTTAPTPLAAAITGGGAGVPIGNIQDVLKKACDALQAQPNVTIHTVATGATAAETTIQIAGQDSASMSAKLPDSIGELVVISPTVYSKEGDKWTKRSDPGGAAAAMGLVRLPAFAYVCFDQADPNSQVKLGALTANMAFPDVVDGVPTLTYEVSGQFTGADNPSSGTIKYWLGATDSLPRKFTVSYKTKDGSGSAEGTYSYNKPDIQAPIP